MLWVIISLVVSILALGVAYYFYKWVKALPSASDKLDQIGKLIYEEMLAVASGKLCKAEILGFNDFAIHRIGPTM